MAGGGCGSLGLCRYSTQYTAYCVDTVQTALQGLAEPCMHACSVISVLSNSLQPMDCSRPSSSVHGILQEEYWSGLPFPSAEDLPDPGIEPGSPALQVDSLSSVLLGKPNLDMWVAFKSKFQRLLHTGPCGGVQITVWSHH